jgi:hypothetical protein
VRAGDLVDITGRGGRPAFTVEDTVGSGQWYAAISAAPFQGDSFTRGDHWDYRRFPTLGRDGDGERALTDLVSHLTRAPFDHDVATYRVVAVPTASGAPTPPGGPTDPYAVPRYPGVRLDTKINDDRRVVP